MRDFRDRDFKARPVVPPLRSRTATISGRYASLPTEELQALLAKLMAARISLSLQIGSGVTEVETPGVGRVQYSTVEEMQLAMQSLDEDISRIESLLGINGVRRRPIHMVAIE